MLLYMDGTYMTSLEVSWHPNYTYQNLSNKFTENKEKNYDHLDLPKGGQKEYIKDRKNDVKKAMP